jgi:hypothetical protein
MLVKPNAKQTASSFHGRGTIADRPPYLPSGSRRTTSAKAEKGRRNLQKRGVSAMVNP